MVFGKLRALFGSATPTMEMRITERKIVDEFADSEWDHLPAWSRDGSRVALIYRAEGALRMGIVKAEDLYAGDFSRILCLEEKGLAISEMSWHPDGSRLLAGVARNDEFVIREYMADSPGMFRDLPLPSPSGNPTWHPDGTAFIFIGKREGISHPGFHLRGYSVDSATEGPMGYSLSDKSITHRPIYSPDGFHLAYVKMLDDSASQVWHMKFGLGENSPALPSSKPPDTRQNYPTWCGESRYLAFTQANFKDQGDFFDGVHVIILDTGSGRWDDLKRQEQGKFLRGNLAWRPGHNDLLCRVDDGLALLRLERTS